MAPGSNQARVTAFFDDHASNYGDFFREDTRSGAAELFRARRAIATALLAGKTGALLDGSGGTGEITQAVNTAGTYRQVWVNDISPAMLQASRAVVTPAWVGQTVRFVNGDIFQIEQTDALILFDVILCLGLIAHVGRLDELLAIFGRLLNPGGTVAIQTTVLTHPGVRAARVVNDRRVAMGGVNPVHYFSLPQIIALAEVAGFRTVAVRRFGACLPFGDKLLGPINYQIERAFARRVPRDGGEAILVFERTA